MICAIFKAPLTDWGNSIGYMIWLESHMIIFMYS